MPKVAQYGGPQAVTEVARQPRADASAGSAITRSNIQAAQGLASVAQQGLQMMQRIDTTSAEEALLKFEKDKNNLFFNPENGYFNTEGRNAYDNAGATSDALKKIKQQYAEGLSDNARMMYEKSVDAHITRSEVDIAQHSSKGLKAWEVSTINAQVENTLENASLYWNQPERLAVQNVLGRQAVIDAAEMEGISADATNERLQTYNSSFAKSSIIAALGSSSTSGKKMFDKYGDWLEGAERAKLENMISAKKNAESTQYVAQKAILLGTNYANDYDNREDVRNKVNEIKDPELRKKTMTEAMRQFNLKKQAESEAQAEAFEAAESHIVEGGSAETFQAENPEGWERLSAKQKKSIQTGKSVITDWNTYSNLMTLPKEQLADVDPTYYYDKLAPAQRNKLISAVKSAKGTGSASNKVDHQVGRTRNAQTTAALETLFGDKKSKWNTSELEKANAFYSLLDDEVSYRESQKGGNLTSEEFTDVLSDLTRKSVVEIDWWPDEELDITDLDANTVNVLSKFLRDNNVPVTSENLIKAHRQATK